MTKPQLGKFAAKASPKVAPKLQQPTISSFFAKPAAKSAPEKEKEKNVDASPSSDKENRSGSAGPKEQPEKEVVPQHQEETPRQAAKRKVNKRVVVSSDEETEEKEVSAKRPAPGEKDNTPRAKKEKLEIDVGVKEEVKEEKEDEQVTPKGKRTVDVVASPEEKQEEGEKGEPPSKRRRAAKTAESKFKEEEEGDEGSDDAYEPPSKKSGGRGKEKEVKLEDGSEGEEEEEEEKPKRGGRQVAKRGAKTKAAPKAKEPKSRGAAAKNPPAPRGRSKKNKDASDEEEGEERASPPASTKKTPSSLSLLKYSAAAPKEPGVLKGKGNYTPLEQQYVDIKARYPDAILFVECGYKFRFFGEDAEIAARELNIYCHMDHNFMTASIPVHRVNVHVRRLVELNYKVGVVRQTETAALKAVSGQKTGPFGRELSALYTKSTLVGEDVNPLSESGEDGDGFEQANYLMCLTERGDSDEKTTIGFVAVHLGTGEMIYDEFTDGVTRTELQTRIVHLSPSELLIPQALSHRTEATINNLTRIRDARIERQPAECFDYNTCFATVSDFFAPSTKKKDQAESAAATKLGALLQQVINLPSHVISCVGALITYLKVFKLERVFTLSSANLVPFSGPGHMRLNGKTVENMELFVNQTDCKETGSLLWVLDHTRTAFGKRLLKKWISRPLVNLKDIEERLDAVGELRNSGTVYVKQIKDLLQGLPDLERGLTRIYYRKCSTAEFYHVLRAFKNVAKAFEGISASRREEGSTCTLLDWVFTENMQLVTDHVTRFMGLINAQAAKEGDKTKLFEDKDLFPALAKDKEKIEAVIGKIMAHRSEVRQILKRPGLDYVTVSGQEYLVEVPNTVLSSVPRDWTKISSTKLQSRFRSPRLEALLQELQQHREQLQADANEGWAGFLTEFGSLYDEFHEVSGKVATLDCLLSLADLSNEPGYNRPTFDPEGRQAMRIVQGKHPMVAAMLTDQYVPNDITLDESNRCMIITGPNMGGKSCYMRQVALLAIMAQIGSYVPAESAEMGIFDAVYTRMGAQDHIQRGMSTFMVELQDASEVMHQATDRSLVILDELGRGTSTHDGVAIAYATAHYLINDIRCTTLFATHYPLITQMEMMFPDRVANYHMSFMQDNIVDTCEDAPPTNEDDGHVEHITFLYQMVRGSAKRSYGLNVARLAGIPPDILLRAGAKSRELEEAVAARSGLMRKENCLFRRLASVLADAPHQKEEFLNGLQHIVRQLATDLV